MTSGHGMHPIQQRKLQCYVKGQTEIGLGGAFVHQRLLAVCCQLVEVTHTLVSLVCDTTCLQLQQDPSCDLGPQDTGVYVTLSNCKLAPTHVYTACTSMQSEVQTLFASHNHEACLWS